MRMASTTRGRKPLPSHLKANFGHDENPFKEPEVAHCRPRDTLKKSARLPLAVCAILIAAPAFCSAPLPLVIDVEQQPLVSATRRLVDALDFIGAPLKSDD